MFTCIWNLLRICKNLEPTWAMEFETRKGKMQPCQYPREKVALISKISAENEPAFKIGPVIESIWNPKIRNAFMHSNYVLWDNTREFMPTDHLIPNKRKKPHEHEVIEDQSISFEDIERYCDAALLLMSEFNKKYNCIARYFWEVIYKR